MHHRAIFRGPGLWLSVFFIFAFSGVSHTVAQTTGSKAELTPGFWQRDPDADFPDEGKMHCAPTAVSDGLIYLSKATGRKNLVPGTGHSAQIKLISELAEDFATDPSVGGTNPDKILTGLQEYAEEHGFVLKRLELKSWRGVSADNRAFKIGTKPDLAWIRKAVADKDSVVIFNFGWYKETEDGYQRDGGHWVDVAGVSGNEFIIRNPILQADQQLTKTQLDLSMIDNDFVVQKASDETNMRGWYEGNGPALPHGKTITAILDAVIVFTIDTGGR